MGFRMDIDIYDIRYMLRIYNHTYLYGLDIILNIYSAPNCVQICFTSYNDIFHIWKYMHKYLICV